jgi:serine/threonine protein kinase
VDFGSASAATSKKLVTTDLQRGSESYRAPEVLTHARYNKRSDIFALGCISYEIVTGQRLFRSDWAVHKYVEEGSPLYPKKWPPCQSGTRLLQLGELTSALLAADPMSRISAKATAQQLRRIRCGEEESEESELADDHDDFQLGSDDNMTERLSNPVVQPSLRVGGVRRPDQKRSNFTGGQGTSDIVAPTAEQNDRQDQESPQQVEPQQQQEVSAFTLSEVGYNADVIPCPQCGWQVMIGYRCNNCRRQT